MSELTTVPSLDELLKHPESALALPPQVAQPLLIQVNALQSLLMTAALKPSTMIALDDLLTVPEVAQRLKVSAYRAYELVRQGHIKKVPLGKSVRVRLVDLNKYVAQQGS